MRWNASDDVAPEVEALLRARADRLRAPSVVEDASEERWVGEFPLGSSVCLLPLRALEGVGRLRSVTPVPLAPPAVIGVLLHGREMIVAYSLAALLGGLAVARDPSVLLVLALSKRVRIAVDCESVPQARALPARLLAEARPNTRGPGAFVSLPDAREAWLIDPQTLHAAVREKLGR